MKRTTARLEREKQLLGLEREKQLLNRINDLTGRIAALESGNLRNRIDRLEKEETALSKIVMFDKRFNTEMQEVGVNPVEQRIKILENCKPAEAEDREELWGKINALEKQIQELQQDYKLETGIRNKLLEKYNQLKCTETHINYTEEEIKKKEREAYQQGFDQGVLSCRTAVNLVGHRR